MKTKRQYKAIRNTIIIGSNGLYKILPWKNSNGILIAGKSGSGKTQTLSYYLTQYVYNGSKLVVCDFGAAAATSEALLDRIEHLESAFMREPATDGKTIVEYIEWIQELGDKRYDGRIPTENHFPILFVIDEFAAFIMQNKPPKVINTTKKKGIDEDGNEQSRKEDQGEPNFLEKLIASVLKFRKVNIHFIFASQDWTQMGTTGIRALRSNVTDVIIHKLDNNGAKLFGFTKSEEIRKIENLRVGQIIYNKDLEPYQVPLLTDAFIDKVVAKLNNMPVKVYKYPRDKFSDNDVLAIYLGISIVLDKVSKPKVQPASIIGKGKSAKEVLDDLLKRGGILKGKRLKVSNNEYFLPQ